MKRHVEWALSLIPTLLVAIIIFLSLISGSPFMTETYLRILSLSSSVMNFLQNQLSLLKYATG